MGDQEAQNGVAQNRIRCFECPNKPARTCAILASTTSVLLGYNISVMSGAATLIKHDLKITPWQVAALVATASGFNPFTSYVSNQIGRRHTMILASAFFLVGQLLMGLAPYYSTLLSGRLIASFGVSFTFMIVPIYAAEISPASSRGFLASFPEFFINVGVTLGYASNMVFSKLPLHLGWRLMLGVGAIPSVFLAVGFLFLPESPYWLVMKNRDDEARQVLRKISASEAEAASRLVDLQAATGNGPRNDVVQVPTSGCCNLLKEFIPRPTRSVCHIFIAAVGLNFFQQATGIDAVVLYAPRILKKAGIEKGLRKPIITLVVGVVKTVFSVFPAFGLDRIGRRSFLLASVGGMFVSLVSLGLGLTMLDRTADRPVWAQVLCMITLAVYVASYSIGMGPITWLYTTEIVLYSLHVQGAGMGMLVNRVTSGVLLLTFVKLYEAITIGGAFFLFAGISAVAWVFVYKLLPETKGKKLEEIEPVFGGAWFVR